MKRSRPTMQKIITLTAITNFDSTGLTGSSNPEKLIE